MRFKQICFLTLSCLLIACSDDSSSSSANEDISSSSVSEFSPIVFTKLGKNKLLAGESFKIGFSGTISTKMFVLLYFSTVYYLMRASGCFSAITARASASPYTSTSFAN